MNMHTIIVKTQLHKEEPLKGIERLSLLRTIINELTVYKINGYHFKLSKKNESGLF